MVTAKEIRETAQLARLHIEEEALPALAAALDELLAFAAGVQQDAGTALPFEGFAPLAMPLREDVVCPSLPREAALCNAADREEDCFAVWQGGVR